MEELRGVELLPEPGEPKILSAVDPSTAGHEGQWRAEVTGWAPVLPETVPFRTRRVFFTCHRFCNCPVYWHHRGAMAVRSSLAPITATHF